MSDCIDRNDLADGVTRCLPPMVMRTAREHYEVAGYESFCYAVLAEAGLVFVEGKGGRCVMRQAEWAAYQALCLEGAPSASMLAVEAQELREENARLKALLRSKAGVIMGDLLAAFRREPKEGAA